MSLQSTSKRYHRLIGNIFPDKSRNNMEMLREICEGGFESLMSWFLGRGNLDLRWSVLVHGVKFLLTHGNSLIFIHIISYFSYLIHAAIAAEMLASLLFLSAEMPDGVGLLLPIYPHRKTTVQLLQRVSKPRHIQKA